MRDFLVELFALATPAGALALLNIVLIDVVMSGDNALLIGMAVRKLQGRQRRQAIVFGVVLATLARVGLAMAATGLLKVVGVKLAGGFLLLCVAWKFYRDLRAPAHAGDAARGSVRVGLMAAVWTIVVADLSMSLDNVLAVAGASHGNFAALSIGLGVSIVLMAFASGLVARLLDRHAWIQWAGFFVILFVAVGMVLSGSDEASAASGIPVLPFVVTASCAAFCLLHAKFIRPAGSGRAWLSRHHAPALAAAVLASMALLSFGGPVSAWFAAHPSVRYFLLLVLLGVLLEALSPDRPVR